MIDQDKLCHFVRENFHYNPNTGQLWRKFKTCYKLVLQEDGKGYLCTKITIDKETYKTYAHRLCWFLYHGEFPKQVIDHINHNRKDNRICNLQNISMQENSRKQLPPVCPHCHRALR